MQLFDIWLTNSNGSEFVKTLSFTSQENADLFLSDMSFNGNEYKAVPQPTEPEPNYSFPPASSSEPMYDIWCTDGKKSEVVETLPFSSQEKADTHASDMDFENNEYWAQVKP